MSNPFSSVNFWCANSIAEQIPAYVNPAFLAAIECGGINIRNLDDADLEAILTLTQAALAHRIKGEAVMKSPNFVRSFCQANLAAESHEVFAVLYLDAQHRVVAFKKHFFGTIDSATVHPRIIVKEALTQNAAAVILVHNHPSGCLTPSEADIHMTKQLKKILEIVDVNVLDHFVVSTEGSTSLAERGLI